MRIVGAAKGRWMDELHMAQDRRDKDLPNKEQKYHERVHHSQNPLPENHPSGSSSKDRMAHDDSSFVTVPE